MRNVLIGLSLGFLLLVFASGNVYAEMCGCMGKTGKGMHEEGMPMMEGMTHRGMGAEHRMWRHLRGLGLDEKQRQAIREIKGTAIKDTIRKRADLQVAAVELKDILHKEPVDMNAVEAKLKQIASLRTDIHLSHIKAMEEVKALLTPEQKEKFKKSVRRHGRWSHGEMGKAPSCGKKGNKQPAKDHMHQ